MMENFFELALAQGSTPIQWVCGFCNFTSIGGFVSNLFIPAFSIAGTLLVLYVLWGGFKWIMSGGNKESIASAQAMITHAAIGIALLVLLFVIFRLIPNYFGANFNIF